MVIQGHPRSMIVTLVLSCPVSPFQRYFRFSAEKSDLTPIPPEFWGVSLGLVADVVAPMCEDPKLIIS